MVKLYSIDPLTGSQGLSSDFYDYHRKYGGLWYVKNERDQFIAVSNDFSSVFLKCDSHQCLPDIIDDQSTFGFFNERIKEIERCVRNDKKRRILLVSVFAQGKQEPYIITIKPFINGVYGKIDSLFFMGFERKIVSALCNNKMKLIKSNAQENRFHGVNPFLTLDPDDWFIAWLMSIGCSQREIAEQLSLNTRTIEKRIADIYTELIVLDYDTFMAMSTLHQWSKFIPPGISTHPILFELDLM